MGTWALGRLGRGGGCSRHPQLGRSFDGEDGRGKTTPTGMPSPAAWAAATPSGIPRLAASALTSPAGPSAPAIVAPRGATPAVVMRRRAAATASAGGAAVAASAEGRTAPTTCALASTAAACAAYAPAADTHKQLGRGKAVEIGGRRRRGRLPASHGTRGGGPGGSPAGGALEEAWQLVGGGRERRLA